MIGPTASGTPPPVGENMSLLEQTAGAEGWLWGGWGPQGGGCVVGRGDGMRRCVGVGLDWVGLDRIVSARIAPDGFGSDQSGDF